MKTIKQEKFKVKDPLFKAPEPLDQHLNLLPLAFKVRKRERALFFRFTPMFVALLVMEMFWVLGNIFLFVSNRTQFYQN